MAVPSLTTVQQTEFDAMVKAQYQSMGFRLRPTMRMRSDVNGAFVQFRKMGQVVANLAGFQDTVPIQDPGFTPLTANLQKYAAGTAVDEIQDLTVNFDTRTELAMLVAMAVGRRSDQIMIDALTAASLPAANVIPVSTSNMSYSKLRNVVQVFEQNAVPVGDRYVAMSGNNWRALLNDDHITSRLYTSNDAVVSGNANWSEILGINPIIIPTMPEGGLPLSGTVRTCFAWHKMSMGMGIGQDLRTEINYLPRETTWFVNGLFYAGAVAVDTLGICSIACDESVNP